MDPHFHDDAVWINPLTSDLPPVWDGVECRCGVLESIQRHTFVSCVSKAAWPSQTHPVRRRRAASKVLRADNETKTPVKTDNSSNTVDSSLEPSCPIFSFNNELATCRAAACSKQHATVLTCFAIACRFPPHARWKVFLSIPLPDLLGPLRKHDLSESSTYARAIVPSVGSGLAHIWPDDFDNS